MSNEFYAPTGNPATGSEGLSVVMRAEFLDIAAGFDLLPTMGGHPGQVVVVNVGGTALTLTVGQLALSGNLSTMGAFNTVLVQQASVSLFLPPVDGTLATLAGTETFTGKTFVSPTMTGVPVAPTAAPGTNTTQIATTAFDTAAVLVETTRALGVEALKAPLASPALTGTPTAPTATSGTNNTQIATTAFTAATVAAAGAIPNGTISGLTLSNSSTTVLGIAAGRATDSLNAIVLVYPTAFTKSISATWAVGTGNGGMGTGLTATASTWYHVFAIIVSAVRDVYFDTSITAANAPAGTTAFRYIGSFLLDGSAHIVPFVQNGDRFDWVTPVLDFSVTPGVTTAITLVLHTPLGVVTQAVLNGVYIPQASNTGFRLSSLYQVDVTPTTGGIPTAGITGYGAFPQGWDAAVFTNTSSSIRMRSDGASDQIYLFTNGWIDQRGK